ncbi:nose resistant to fluoxetine protein 6 [Calliopsis andreniformis]|uniref:nose resistant to fluoxetine protein 6 n=1 Tax=Calliopsis andreniformis TaxID=337506 RepID=UPI003FCEAB88
MEYRIILFLPGILASIQLIQGSQAGQVDTKTLKETLPVYAVVSNLDLLNSNQCKTELQRFRDGVDSGTLWSLRMLDASGEPGSGYTEGNNYWLGQVQQCNYLSANTSLPVSSKVLRNNSLFRDPTLEHPPFELRFFAARMLQNSTMQYHVEIRNENLVTLGLCMPASCTKGEVATLLEKILRDRTLLVSQLYAADFKLIEISDLMDDHQWLLSGKIILIILILSFSVGLVIMGTLYDLLVYQKRLQKKKELIAFENNNTAELKIDAEAKRETKLEKSEVSDTKPETKLGQIIMCFSAYTNLKGLFRTDTPSESLLMFHGLKLYGMIWIIIAHTIYFSNSFVGNRSIMYMTTGTLVAQAIGNATFSVDTFFCISGFLLAYAYLQAQKKEKVASWQTSVTHFYMMFLKRYIRLTPAYLLIIMISILNFSWYNRTSLFRDNERIDELCSKYWWRNLLYINNFFPWDDLCLSWSWYLTNDMQFFVFGSFLLVLSSIHLYAALSLGILSLIGSMFISGYIGYTVEYYITLDEMYANLETLYMRPWTRIPPFLVGMMTGCLLIKWDNKLHLSTKAKIVGWTLGILCNVSILFAPGFGEPPFTVSIFYITVARAAWGLGIMWIIIACLTNNGGIVNKFLSLRMWIPLSRLTYTFYLINPFLIISIYLASSYPSYSDILMTGASAFGIFLVSYVCAMALSLVGEMPAILLLRLFFNTTRQTK